MTKHGASTGLEVPHALIPVLLSGRDDRLSENPRRRCADCVLARIAPHDCSMFFLSLHGGDRLVKWRDEMHQQGGGNNVAQESALCREERHGQAKQAVVGSKSSDTYR